MIICIRTMLWNCVNWVQRWSKVMDWATSFTTTVSHCHLAARPFMFGSPQATRQTASALLGATESFVVACWPSPTALTNLTPKSRSSCGKASRVAYGSCPTKPCCSQGTHIDCAQSAPSWIKGVGTPTLQVFPAINFWPLWHNYRARHGSKHPWNLGKEYDPKYHHHWFGFWCTFNSAGVTQA